MQPLIVLSAAFAFLVTYLEWNPDSSSQLQADYVFAAEVIRDASANPISSKERRAAGAADMRTVKTAPQSRKPLDLDLALPIPMDTAVSAPIKENSLSIDLFETRQREGISYEAELVFDRETGEDVTGGKVNIRIPLT